MNVEELIQAIAQILVDLHKEGKAVQLFGLDPTPHKPLTVVSWDDFQWKFCGLSKEHMIWYYSEMDDPKIVHFKSTGKYAFSVKTAYLHLGLDVPESVM